MPRKKPPAHLRKPPGRPALYPWDVWLDGSTHLIQPGEHYDCDNESMRQQIYVRARKEGVKVSVRVFGDGLSVHADRQEAPRGASVRYNWDHLLDGEVHQLRTSTEINGKITNFRIYARSVARERDLRLVTRLVGDLLILQAVPRSSTLTPADLRPPAPVQPKPAAAEKPAFDLSQLPFAVEDPLLDPRPKL